MFSALYHEIFQKKSNRLCEKNKDFFGINHERATRGMMKWRDIVRSGERERERESETGRSRRVRLRLGG